MPTRLPSQPLPFPIQFLQIRSIQFSLSSLFSSSTIPSLSFSLKQKKKNRLKQSLSLSLFNQCLTKSWSVRSQRTATGGAASAKWPAAPRQTALPCAAAAPARSSTSSSSPCTSSRRGSWKKLRTRDDAVCRRRTTPAT